MGTAASTSGDEHGSRPGSDKDRSNSAKERSRQIDRELMKEKEEKSQKFQILLLGGSECGKTTIFKQMKILHLNGFTKEEKSIFVNRIRKNLIESLSQLLEACQKYRIVHESILQDQVQKFMKFRAEINEPESEEDKEEEKITIAKDMGSIINRLWFSAPVQMVYKRRWSFALLDSAKYFLDATERIVDPNYEPSVQDILQCRFRTTGTQEITFTYNKMEFKMVDVGGQRSERRKWIHCFDNVNMVLFVVAMSDYDQKDPEDESQNRLNANRHIFKTIVQSDFFKHAAIVLFLNKYDTFQDKVVYSSMSKHFKEFNGEDTIEDASKFLLTHFQRCIRDKNKFFTFFTTATDTRNIDFVFGSAVAHIINQNLKATGNVL